MMDEINRQVRQARRRMVTRRFLKVFAWSLFAGMLVAVIGLAIPKIWHLPFLTTVDHHEAWMAAWLIGGGVLSLIVAGVLTYRGRPHSDDAAIEVDRRFGLRERLTSAMTLEQRDRGSDAGRALLRDAEDRASTIDVRDKFKMDADWRLGLPLIPILLLLAIAFLPNAVADQSINAADASLNREQLKVAIKEMKKKVEEQQKSLLAKGLEDAAGKLDPLKKKLDNLNPEQLNDRKDALVKLNDIRKQIEDRQKELGDNKGLKESLNKLKDVGSGPAKKIAEAMSKGDMDEARKLVKDLADKLKSGEMTAAEKKKLAKDLEAVADQMKKIVEQNAAKKEALKKEIEEAIEKGDMDKAAKAQEKLNQQQQQEKQMDKMKQMAKSLKQCAECMKKGGQKGGQSKPGQKGEGQKTPSKDGQPSGQQMDDAAKALEELEAMMKEMGDEMDELESLEDLEEAAGECKGCINGQPDADQPPQWKDWAKGSGRGGGKREREDEETGKFKSRVKAKLQKGQTIVTGDADGNNISGRTESEVRELVKTSMSDDSDPLENQVLPKSQRDHAQEYFNQLREGQ